MCIPAPSSSLKPALTIKASQLAKAHHRVQVPRIIITPPDEPARFSSALPEQTYEKSVLFVPSRPRNWAGTSTACTGTAPTPIPSIRSMTRKAPPSGADAKVRRATASKNTTATRSRDAPRRARIWDDTVEEASVRLEEPAPARIQGYNRASTSGQDEQEHIEKPAECDEDEAASPTSPDALSCLGPDRD
ncbi:hypothetical protein L1887_51751 [Cichorium endivia]|nr:hypothetical protein L1887_51751 [Cichorium endivia]